MMPNRTTTRRWRSTLRLPPQLDHMLSSVAAFLFKNFGRMLPPIVGHLIEALLRRKRLDRANLHSEWGRRLGTFGAATIALALALAFSLYIILPGIFAAQFLDQNGNNSSSSPIDDPQSGGLHLASSLLPSFVLISVLLLLSAYQLSAASRQTGNCRNSPLYQLAFGLAGRGAAFWVAWSQLLDLVAALAITAHSLSEHTNFLFNPTNLLSTSAAAPPSLARHQIDPIIFAAALPVVAGLLLLCTFRVLLTVTTMFLIATLFTTASTGTVALLHAIGHWNTDGQFVMDAGGALVPPLSKVMADARWLLLAFLPLESITFLTEESTRPARTIGPVIVGTAKAQCALTLVALLAFLPLLPHSSSSIPSSSFLLPLPALFNSVQLPSARYLMSVGSVCALLAAHLCLFLPATRLLVLLAHDKMLPSKWVGQVAKGGQVARQAALLVALLATLAVLFLPKCLLLRMVPLNLTLRMNCQAVLVYLAHFLPSLRDPGPEPEYRRVRGANEEEDEEEGGASEWSEESSEEETEDWRGGGSVEEEEKAEEEGKGQENHASMAAALHSEVNVNTPLTAMATKSSGHHNCLRSPCGGLQHPHQHLYEWDVDGRSGGGRRVVVESGTRAAASLDEDQAYGRAKWALSGIAMLAVVCALSLRALLETREYMPILALVALLLSLPLSLWIAIWLARTRADSSSSKWPPLGSMFSSFALTQLASLLLPNSEWARLAGWNLLGLFVLLASLLRRRHWRRQGAGE